jgi:hypothetical protein
MVSPIESVGHGEDHVNFNNNDLRNRLTNETERLRDVPEAKPVVDELDLLRLEISQGELANVGALMGQIISILSTLPGSPNQVRAIEEMVREARQKIQGAS